MQMRDAVTAKHTHGVHRMPRATHATQSISRYHCHYHHAHITHQPPIPREEATRHVTSRSRTHASVTMPPPGACRAFAAPRPPPAAALRYRRRYRRCRTHMPRKISRSLPRMRCAIITLSLLLMKYHFISRERDHALHVSHRHYAPPFSAHYAALICAVTPRSLLLLPPIAAPHYAAQRGEIITLFHA